MRRIVIAVATASLSAAAVSPAHAYAGNSCSLYAVADSQVYEGAMVGMVADSAPVALRCYVTVNGGEVATTPTVQGPTGVAAIAARVRFAASDTDYVVACTEVTASTGPGTHCHPATLQPCGVTWCWVAPSRPL